MSSRLLFIAAIITISATSFIYITNSSTIDFTTQVKPIINKSCINCHGGVRQKGGFSLLFREEALAKTESGKLGIVPGDPSGSEMIRRINLKDPEERMPYKHDPLSKEEINILTKWVKQGAQWGQHWAYAPVKDVPIPKPGGVWGFTEKTSDWAKNGIDNFIQQKLLEQDLKPSLKADKQTLLRRVSLDVIGMPAPEKLATRFLQDNSEHAYTELVDSLLSLPAYGEKWTSMWLDLARYADTKGYEADGNRDIWKYRDWLIRAFNNDKPYDRFLTEQIAGDLLPSATEDDIIATAFHRNTMTNDEGGTDSEEFRTAAVLDRVNTTWQATLGTTFACVQCHAHPYDPFKHEDYYKFMAFFNNTRDEDTFADYPVLRHYDDSMQNQIDNVVKWVEQNVSSEKAAEVNTFLKTWQPSYNSFKCDSFTNSEITSARWLAFRNNALCRLKNVDLENRDQLIFRYRADTTGGLWEIHIDHPLGPLVASIVLPQARKDWSITEAKITGFAGRHDLYFTYKNNKLKKPLANGAVFDWFYFTRQMQGKEKPGYAQVKESFWKLLSANVPTTPVMMDNPSFMHRTTYVFERGNWLTKGETVEPDVPKSLNPFPAKAPRNRLGMAMWLTSKQNPLTARTMVNRVWEQVFGTGLAETLEDLGSQGINPTHPELLDWLSYRFMHEDNWSIKKLIRKMVLSATYQQQSKVTPELLQKDPSNKYYARGARVRLSAEQVRDQALCVSRLMSNKMYGAGVYPFQPPGIWLSPYNGAEWKQSEGEDQYRRAVYTYWKRSAAYPSTLTFDGVSREVCTPRRIRTNTPLQALTALNDSVYVDIARHFASRMQNKAGATVSKQIAAGYAWATNHEIDERRTRALMNLYNKAFNRFKNDPVRTCEMNGNTGFPTEAETAALTVVANAILNLDEVVMKN
ncbi:MAG: hypothetical protein JWR18_990 [Segetibacter sp.]|nr:hypothetical protein [Segetibacter sp.]